MPILPSSVCGEWSGRDKCDGDNCSAFEQQPAGRRLFTKSDRDGGALPTTPTDADFGRHKRLFYNGESKDAIGNWESWADSKAGGVRFTRGRSEASLITSDEARALPSAGCPHTRIGEMRGDYCPHRLGRHKARANGAPATSVAHSSDARVDPSFRFHMDPNENQAGKQQARSDGSVHSQKACAEHRFYFAPDDRVSGHRQRASKTGRQVDGVAEALRADEESVECLASKARPRQRSLPPRMAASSCASDLSWLSPSATPNSLSYVSADAGRQMHGRKPSITVSTDEASSQCSSKHRHGPTTSTSRLRRRSLPARTSPDSVSQASDAHPNDFRAFTPRPHQRRAPMRASSVVSDESRLSAPEPHSAPSSTTCSLQGGAVVVRKGTLSARGRQQKYAGSLPSESTRGSESSIGSYDTVTSEQVQWLRERMKERVRMYRACGERDSRGAPSECSSVTARWEM